MVTDRAFIITEKARVRATGTENVSFMLSYGGDDGASQWYFHMTTVVKSNFVTVDSFLLSMRGVLTQNMVCLLSEDDKSFRSFVPTLFQNRIPFFRKNQRYRRKHLENTLES